MEMNSKKLDLNKTVYDLCTEDSEIMNILASLGFKGITMPGMLQSAGRYMTIPKGAAMKKIDMDKIRQTFRDHGYTIEE